MQESSIQQFQSEQFGNLRTIMDENGNPLFCAKDVAIALGYKDPTNAIKRHCRGVAFQHPLQTTGGVQQVRFITEGDMYRLVASSKLDAAIEFESWVFDEVIPSIRKTGKYENPQAIKPHDIDPQTIYEIMADPRNLARVFNALADEQQKNQALTEDNARMLPKAMAYDAIIDTDGTSTVTEVARYLAQMDKRMTVKRLFALLRSDHLICKCDRAPTKLAIKRGLAKQIMTVRKDGTRNEPYARLTTKGIDYCIEHYIASPVQMQAI